MAQSVVVTLLASRYRNAETILDGRQRTRGIGGECTGRVLQFIEIEPELSGPIYAMVGKLGVEKASRSVGRRFAGGVAHNKEKVGRFRIFKHRLEPENLSIQRKFSGAGCGHLGRGPEHGWDVEHLRRVIRDPARMNAIVHTWLIPAQSVESDAGGCLQILDAQAELIVSTDHDDGERTDPELRGFVGIVGEEGLLLRG